MTESYYSNAMVDIALALAMAFFSIMVLAMVSMGAGFQESASPVELKFEGIAVAPPASPSGAAAKSDDIVVIHYRGRFLDADLAALDPAQISGRGRVVLAIDPALPMADAIAVRGAVTRGDVIVTTLDERWLQTLEEMAK